MSSETITRNDLTNILNEIVAIDGTDMTAQEIDDFVDSLNITKIRSSVEIVDLLWTNPSPTSAFASQTISLDLSDYDIVELYAYDGSTASYRKEVMTRCHVGENGAFIGTKTIATTSENSIFIQRTFASSATEISFADGVYRLPSATTLSQGNDVYVPTKIYGIKLVQL